jgi:hypothetical protein
MTRDDNVARGYAADTLGPSVQVARTKGWTHLAYWRRKRTRQHEHLVHHLARRETKD